MSERRVGAVDFGHRPSERLVWGRRVGMSIATAVGVAHSVFDETVRDYGAAERMAWCPLYSFFNNEGRRNIEARRRLERTDRAWEAKS